jgi:hypothetical protein
VRHSLRCIALALALGLTAEARSAVTYNLVSYPDDQEGATVSGYFTVRSGFGDLSIFDILDWSITISSPDVGSFTTGQSDPSAMLSPLGRIARSPSEMTIARGEGWLLVQSDNMLLSYDRTGSGEYSADVGETDKFGWDTTSPSMGGTDPWVIGRTLAVAVPEPSSFVMLGTAILGLGTYLARRR